MLLDIEINPAAHVVWTTEAVKREEHIKAISRAHYRTEIEMVARGHRACTTANLIPQGFERDIEDFTQRGLIFLPIKRTKKYGGFAHKHVFTTEDDPDSMVYGVVARRLEDAERFRELSLGKVDHGDIGTLLGYPDCCREFFERVWAKEKWIDTIYHQAQNTPGSVRDGHTVSVKGHPFCNQALRYFGIRITSHLPCSWQCEETIRWGELWFSVMRDIDPQAAEDAMHLLSLPVEWNALKGIVICKTELFHGIANTVPCYPAHIVQYTPR